MFDILIFLFESYFESGHYPDSDKLSIKLSAAGFEDEDIHQALSWLSNLRQLNDADYPACIKTLPSSMRCFADLERRRISEEALHFICFWEANQLISPVEREMIIDRAIVLGRDNLSLERIKLITLMVLWNRHDDLDPVLVEELLTPSNIAQFH